MAEFGELLPGTKWRDRDGMRQRISDCHVVAVNRGGRVLVHSERCKEWVPWVEPIAVGDTVTMDMFSIPRTVLGLFTTPAGTEMVVVSSPSCCPDAYHFCPVSECRKVNDE